MSPRSKHRELLAEAARIEAELKAAPHNLSDRWCQRHLMYHPLDAQHWAADKQKPGGYSYHCLCDDDGEPQRKQKAPVASEAPVDPWATIPLDKQRVFNRIKKDLDIWCDVIDKSKTDPKVKLHRGTENGVKAWTLRKARIWVLKQVVLSRLRRSYPHLSTEVREITVNTQLNQMKPAEVYLAATDLERLKSPL